MGFDAIMRTPLCVRVSHAAGVARPIGLVLLLFIMAALPFIWMGPGRDLDSFLVRDVTIKTLLLDGKYVPSRFTGNPTHEFGSTIAYVIGGVWAANLATLVMAVLAGVGFARLCREYRLKNVDLLVALLLFHPVYLSAATYMIDYLWAIACYLWGFLFLRRQRWALAGLLFGLAVGARLASGVPIAAMSLVLIAIERRRVWDVIGAAVVALGVALSLYAPALSYYDYEPSQWLRYAIGDWSIAGHVARWGLRNVYFWGILAIPFLFMATCALRQRAVQVPWSKIREPLLVGLVGVALVELMFLKIPLELGYLLPVLPFALLLVGLACECRRKLLIGMLVATASYNLVSVNFVQPDRQDNASRGLIEFRPQFGFAINGTIERLYLWGRRTVPPQFYFAESIPGSRANPPLRESTPFEDVVVAPNRV